MEPGLQWWVLGEISTILPALIKTPIKQFIYCHNHSPGLQSHLSTRWTGHTRLTTVREPFMKAGWRDAPLALWDLALSNMPHSLNSQNPLSMTKSQCSLFNKNLLFLFFYYYYINNKTFLDQPQK